MQIWDDDSVARPDSALRFESVPDDWRRLAKDFPELNSARRLAPKLQGLARKTTPSHRPRVPECDVETVSANHERKTSRTG